MAQHPHSMDVLATSSPAPTHPAPTHPASLHPVPHDPLSAFSLVHYEFDQRRESGFDVAAAESAFRAADPNDPDELESILATLEAADRLPDWRYEEPEDFDEILASLPSRRAERVSRPLDDAVLGGWLGRIAGCNLGKPVEDGDHWTPEHLRAYLELAGAWPLRDYFPILEPLPEGYEFRDNWPETTRGRVHGSARDDDIDYAIVGLHLLETVGRDFTTGQVADAWLSMFPVLRQYTAERAAYVNLLHSVAPEAAGGTRNPFREWIGALIRGDAFGWVHPGDPRSAMELAYRDARLSHRANGVFGELWSAALVAGAFTASSAHEAVVASLDHVPPRSRLAEALGSVLDCFETGGTWEDGLALIRRDYGHYNWVHTINNAAVITAGILWGGGDFAATVGLTVQGGWDTDSNGATAGSVAGVLLGAAALPPHFIEPLADRTRSAVFGYDNSRISDLAQRTVRLAHEFGARRVS
jgi:ADP-ribosylglycohydrolase